MIELLEFLVQEGAGAAASPPPTAETGPGVATSLIEGLLAQLPWLLFFVIFLIVPAFMRRQQAAELERAFGRIQKKRRTRIIAMIHRQESMGLLGIPVLKYIDLNDAEDLLEAIRRTPTSQPLELILHTPGGIVLPALQIARALKAHQGKTTVYVPHYAMSGGTLIALAADEIVMNRHAVLGPIDPQIYGLPAASWIRVTETKSPDAVDDQTLILADISRKLTDELEAAARELLAGTVTENAATGLARELSSGRWTHGYPIVFEEAKELGLRVSTNMPSDIISIMDLFPARLSRQNVKYFDLASVFSFGRRAREAAAAQAAALAAAPTERSPFTGYEPGPGARSFSYGPWAAKDLVGQLPPGPSASDVRGGRERRFYKVGGR